MNSATFSLGPHGKPGGIGFSGEAMPSSPDSRHDRPGGVPRQFANLD